MRKDAMFRVRVPRKTLAAIKRVAADRKTTASGWATAILEEELARDLAALELRKQIRTAPAGRLTEAEAMRLANEAKRATRAR